MLQGRVPSLDLSASLDSLTVSISFTIQPPMDGGASVDVSCLLYQFLACMTTGLTLGLNL
jgi:hypothetical protein